MISTLMPIGVVLSAALFTSASAFAQSLNLDIDATGAPPALGGGAPSNAFGAASGQIGFWNTYPGTLTNSPFALSDLSGSPIAAALTRTTNTGSGSVVGFNNGSNSGDYALLMNDGSQVGTLVQGGWHQYTFSGLLNGPYQIWTYGAPPSGNPGHTPVEVIGSPDPVQTLNGGSNNNTFTLGGTHAIHNVSVTDGTLTVFIDVPPNAGAAAYINGFQLILIPGPGALAVLGAAGLVGARRRRREGPVS